MFAIFNTCSVYKLSSKPTNVYPLMPTHTATHQDILYYWSISVNTFIGNQVTLDIEPMGFCHMFKNNSQSCTVQQVCTYMYLGLTPCNVNAGTVI